MHAHSPPESVHAFDLDKLRQPDVAFWSAWVGGDRRLRCAQAARRPAGRAEVDAGRGRLPGQGIGRAILDHLIAEARARGSTSLWLETGSSPAFLPALRLYESAGFRRCGPFGEYREDPFSVFMTRDI